MNKKVFSVFLSFLSVAACVSTLFASKEDIKRALMLLNDGKTKEAIEILNNEIKQDSGSDPLTYLALGMAYIDQERYPEALANLESFLKAKPDSVAGHYTMAMLFEKQKDFAKAKDSWEKVLQLARDKELKELAEKHINQISGSK
jgi:Tfp pilus assembly protein PilF